jgi:hypothetical protein
MKFICQNPACAIAIYKATFPAAKGNEPLMFQDGGKTYRAFLEGRTKDQAYVLLIHLSNLKLKGI